jgi:hypothetical protein
MARLSSIVLNYLNRGFVSDVIAHIQYEDSASSYVYFKSLKGKYATITPVFVGTISTIRGDKYSRCHIERRGSSGTTFNNLMNLWSYNFGKIEQFTLRGKENNTIFYVGRGIIMDENMQVLLLLCIKRYEDMSTENLVYINPSVIKSTRMVPKNILKEIVPFYTSKMYSVVIEDPTKFLFNPPIMSDVVIACSTQIPKLLQSKVEEIQNLVINAY